MTDQTSTFRADQPIFASGLPPSQSLTSPLSVLEDRSAPVLQAQVDPEKQYFCPGESQPISRAVHLSRMAAYFPKCKECAHNCETGSLVTAAQEESVPKQGQPSTAASLFQSEGVRGVYLNEMSRTTAEQMTAAFARMLWQESPLLGRMELAPETSNQKRAVSSVTVPQVVVGYDQRPAAPDLVTGVYSRLRLMGCEVIDIGLTTKPCFLHTVHHLQSTAGILVTGANAKQASIGLDFVGGTAVPWSNPGQLSDLESVWETPTSRPRRQSPPQRTFQAFVPYEASLWKHFHALRPLKICCASPSRLVLRTLQRLFESLPCTLVEMVLPLRARNIKSADDADIRNLKDTIQTEKCDFGIAIEEDGMRCALMDEQGELILAEELTLMLAELLLEPARPVLVDQTENETLIATLRMLGLSVQAGVTTQEEISRQLTVRNGFLAGGSSGYFWYNSPFPTADAILTLSHVLQLLSRQVKPFSALRVGAKM